MATMTLRVLHAGEMLDRAGDADGDVELGRHDLAGLADLPVVRRVAGIDRGAARRRRGAELVGERLDALLEVLRRAERAAARDDDRAEVSSGRSDLRELLALEASRAPDRPPRRRSRPAPSRLRRPPAKAVVRTVMTFLASVDCTVCDRVAGIDRPLEGVGRDDRDDVGDLHHVEQRGDARHDVLAGGRRRRDDRVVGAGERDDQRRQRLGQPVRVGGAVGEQHLRDAGELRRRLGDGAGSSAPATSTCDVGAPSACAAVTALAVASLTARVVVLGDGAGRRSSEHSPLRSSACRPARRPSRP